jgi:hypothetical protein
MCTRILFMLNRKLFDAFSQSYDPPHWIIEGLLESDDAEVQMAIIAALEAIPTSEAAQVDEDTDAKLEIIFRSRDHAERARLHLVSSAASQELYQTRMAEVCNHAKDRPKPYDHPLLSGIPVDAEGLVPLSEFQIKGDALCYKGHAFFVLPAVPASNANYWLLQNIQRKGLVNSVSVRLDPLLHGPETELAGNFYRMDVYGRPLDWDRISSLREIEHGRWMPGKLSTKSLFTDYAWIPHANEVDFLCEELPPVAQVQERGARYLHAIYDKRSNCLTHLDGAIRSYEAFELATREKAHVRNAGKMGRRSKVFRTDQPIDAETMGDIVQAFFVWNYDVARYFGAPVPDDI